MKINFKTNLIVFFASISLSSLGVCNAIQSAAAQQPIGSGVVEGVVESPSLGAFGAVRPVEDHSDYFAAKELPPIVSPDQASQSASLPPIISASKAAEQQPNTRLPIAQASQMQVPQLKVPGPRTLNPSERGLPPIVSSQETFQASPPRTAKAPMAASMLAPIVNSKPIPTIQNDPMMAPPTVIQASQVPTESAMENPIQHTQWTSQGHNQSSVSSAGVPLYNSPQKNTNSILERNGSLPPIINSSSQLVAPIKPMAPATQVSSSGLPPIVNSSPIGSMSAPIPTPTVDPYIVNSAPPIVESYPAASPTFPSVDPIYAAPPAPTNPIQSFSPTYFAQPAAEPPVIQSTCNGCGGVSANGTSSCSSCSAAPSVASNIGGGGCSSCGGGGCSSCGVASGNSGGCSTCGNSGCFDPAHVSSRFGASGSVSDSRRYLHADFLYFDRDDGTISNSNFGSLNNFDFSPGWRVTFGAKSDALRGREITYFGIVPVEQTAVRTDPAGRINARFSSADGFTGAETSAFSNAVSQTEFKETGLHSLEFNRVTWGWDVIKSFAGLRYIYIDDEYRITSTNFVGENGTFELNALNNLFGPHIGGEIFYDVGYRMSYSLFSKAGIYANFNKVDTRLENAGAQFMNVEDTSATISTSLELGLLAHYQLSRTARMRFGYNVLWLGDVASVSDNFNPVLSPTAGTNSSDSDDMFFHGFSIGLEIFR